MEADDDLVKVGLAEGLAALDIRRHHPIKKR